MKSYQRANTVFRNQDIKLCTSHERKTKGRQLFDHCFSFRLYLSNYKDSISSGLSYINVSFKGQHSKTKAAN